MSNLEPTEPEPSTVEHTAPVSALGQWARDASDAYQVARSLAPTEFVPQAMRNRPELVTATILTGQEIGLEPMAALRSIDIIQGVPAMRANTMRGLVQSAGHEVWVDEQSNETRAIVYGRRHGSDIVQRSTWTMDRARGLGLANRDNYRKQPGAMLVARGTAEVCRLIASDVLLGMPYATEEIDDESKPSKPETPKPRKRTAKRAPVEAEEPPLPEPEPAPDGDSTTKPVEEPPEPEAGATDA